MDAFNNSSIFINPVTNKEVQNELNKLKPKSSGSDDLNPKVLKQIA